MNNKNIIRKSAIQRTCSIYGKISLMLIMIAMHSCTMENITNKEESKTLNRMKKLLQQTSHNSLVNYLTPLNELMDSLGSNSQVTYILIEKRNYTLTLYSGTKLIKQYPVVFGKNPVDEKLCQGDYCTPEGVFKVLAKYDHKVWSKFIWIDYPNTASLKRHMEAEILGIIPADSNPGGEIGIHGVPANMEFVIAIKENWTAGCIALKNKDIIEVFENVNVGTEVLIRK